MNCSRLPFHRWPRFGRTAGLAVVLAPLGCAPALDWRELSPEGSGVAVQFPCRPDHHARRVPLAGRPVELVMTVCTAQAMTFALARADVGDPALVADALRGLGEAARSNLSGTVEASVPSQVRGMTPNPQARRLTLAGRLPDGSATRSTVLLFARGTQVYQATVMGAAVDAAAAQVFFDAVRFAT